MANLFELESHLQTPCVCRFKEMRGSENVSFFNVEKRIGIKYCGGCNPSYERVEMVGRLQSLLKDRFIFFVNDQQDSDILLFVCGCPRACADEDSNHPQVPSRSVIGESDFDGLVDWLEGLGAKGDL